LDVISLFTNISLDLIIDIVEETWSLCTFTNFLSLLRQEKDNLQKEIFLKKLYEFFSYTRNVWYDEKRL